MCDILAKAILQPLGGSAACIQQTNLSVRPKKPDSPPIADANEETKVQVEGLLPADDPTTSAILVANFYFAVCLSKHFSQFLTVEYHVVEILR